VGRERNYRKISVEGFVEKDYRIAAGRAASQGEASAKSKALIL